MSRGRVQGQLAYAGREFSPRQPQQAGCLERLDLLRIFTEASYLSISTVLLGSCSKPHAQAARVAGDGGVQIDCQNFTNEYI